MKNLLFLLLSMWVVTLTGCATFYRGVYWIKSEAKESSTINQAQAIAIREAVLRVVDEVGFTVTQSAARPPASILPGFTAKVPKEGLKYPYKDLGDTIVHVSLSVAFIYPYSIIISDYANTTESKLVQKIKALLEAEFAKVTPPVDIDYRIDKIRLD